MKFSLAKILLLAAGVSCAPPLELDTSTTTTTTTTTTEAITTAKPTEAPEIVAATTTTGSVVPEVTEAATEAVTKAVVELVTEADIITGLTDPGIETEVTTVLPLATTEQAIASTTLSTTTTTTPPPPPPRLSGKEREALIGHLGNIDLRNTDTLVLTPRQRLAISQELEYQQLGLASFSDPTPWQRLSRDQQEEFNKKYLALSPELQDFSKSQFTSLPEDRQEHAFNMFLQLDLETLSQVISNELVRQSEAQQQTRIAEERQRLAEEQERQRRLEILRARQEFEQGNRFQEVPRNQAATNFNRVAPRQQQFQQQAPQFNPQQQQQRPNFDPRRRQPVP